VLAMLELAEDRLAADGVALEQGLPCPRSKCICLEPVVRRCGQGLSRVSVVGDFVVVLLNIYRRRQQEALQLVVARAVLPAGAVFVQGDGREVLGRIVDPCSGADLGGNRLADRHGCVGIADVAREEREVSIHLPDDVEDHVAAVVRLAFDVSNGQTRVTSPALPADVGHPDEVHGCGLMRVRSSLETPNSA
jgi:hypothetical protein